MPRPCPVLLAVSIVLMLAWFGWVVWAQGDTLGDYIDALWPKIRPGGLVMTHSSVTNQLTRGWLDQMRTR